MNTSNTGAQVAKTIISQLGGNKFIAMTGSKNFAYGTNDSGNDYISMHLTRNAAKAKFLIVTLTPSDTYNMEFIKIDKELNRTVVAQKEGVYCDMLQDIFTNITGLYTSL
jgi:hypothetical protein